MTLALDERGDLLDDLSASLTALGQSLETRFEHARRLSSITEKINTGLLMDDVLEHAYASFRNVIPYTRIGCALLEGGGIVRSAWAKTDAAKVHLKVGYAAKLEGSSLQQILESGRPRVINDLSAYLDTHPRSESTRMIVKEGIRSSLTCPLIALGKPIGFLFFSSSEPGAYADAHVQLYAQLASHLSTIVEKSRLYQELLETQAQLVQANKQLSLLASMDGLTGVPNRRFFDEQLALEWRRATRAGSALSVLMLDVDEFKRFNDRYGHQAGDDCLKAVASALSSRIQRAGDFLARYGGEEFVIVLPNTPPDRALVLAQALCARVAALSIPHADSRAGEVVSVSIGVAGTVKADGSHGELVALADKALYAAKQAGRNRAVVADPI